MVKRIIDAQHISFARALRRNQTDAERILWNQLRNLQLDGVKFRRQHPIGNYIVDFDSLDRKLIIELDGGQHNEEQVKEKDEQRTKWLESEGYKILRFWDNDVLSNTEGVILLIQEALK
jgi:very-short-patch-repair endonuclease